MNIVVGSINYDFTIYVDRFPEVGQTVTDGTLFESPGGKGLNQAVASARAGSKTKFIGCVGDDIIADMLLDFLKQESKKNKNFQHTLIVSKGKTGCAFITVRSDDGKNEIVVSPGANKRINKSKVYQELKRSKFDSILLQCELEEDIVEMCIHFSRKNGKRVFLNTAPFKEWVKDVYHLADFVVMNELEASALASRLKLNSDTSHIARYLADKVSGGALITLGEKGVIFCNKKEFFHMPAFSVRSVDTVGAGDSFCGYFASFISRGYSIKEAVVYASAAGAISTTKKGAFSSIPYINEVLRFLKNSQKPEIKELSAS